MGELGYNVSDERGCDAAMAVCGGMCVWLGQGFVFGSYVLGRLRVVLDKGFALFCGCGGECMHT